MSDYNQFFKLAQKIKELKEKSQLFRDILREQGPGKYEGATVYKVEGHKVRAHWRSGWTAVRVRKPQ